MWNIITHLGCCFLFNIIFKNCIYSCDCKTDFIMNKFEKCNLFETEVFFFYIINIFSVPAEQFNVFKEPKRSSTSPREPMLHLSLSPCTGYQLQLASSSRHWCLHIEQPQAQHPPTSTHYYELTSPPEVWDLLVSDASWYHHREAQNHSPEHSLSPFLASGMIFPSLSRPLDPCQFSSNNWKLISFNSTWLLKKKIKKHLSLFQNLHLSLSLLPLLACIYLNNAWDLVLLDFLCLFASSRLVTLCIPQL